MLLQSEIVVDLNRRVYYGSLWIALSRLIKVRTSCSGIVTHEMEQELKNEKLVLEDK